jgi:S-adenosylmethionine/arginine decarboxylase-like enzyme
MLHFLRKFFKLFRSKKHQGNHIFGDFVWNVKNEDKFKIDDIVLGNIVFKIMQDSLLDTSMTVVHKKLCILGKNLESEPGFTSVLLIDESHITSHCYSDRGLLAIDVFTCGNTDPISVMNYIESQLLLVYPSLKCTYKKNHKRFHF